MQKLATTHWMQNNINTKGSTCSRIEWIKFQCEEYFLNEGKQKYDLKEEDIKLKIEEKNKNRPRNGSPPLSKNYSFF